MLGKDGMFYLLVTLSLLCMGTGVFIVGFGVPIRETAFGAGLLVAGTVAITGGFVLVGLAAAVAELQLMVKALRARVPTVPRPLRPVDRKEGGEKRPGPPRVLFPARPGADAPPVNAEAPPSAPPRPEQEPVHLQPRPEWLRRAMAEIESAPAPAAAGGGPDPWPRQAGSGPDPWPRQADLPPVHAAAPEHAEPRPPPPGPAPSSNRFDAIWPSDRRRGPEVAPEKPAEPEPPPRASEMRPAHLAPPPPPLPPPPAPPPESAPGRNEERSPSILKSGVIDEMAYTLFTDGSIEAQMPDGTMRFASIDELREHLHQHGG